MPSQTPIHIPKASPNITQVANPLKGNDKPSAKLNAKPNHAPNHNPLFIGSSPNTLRNALKHIPPNIPIIASNRLGNKPVSTPSINLSHVRID
jgi:hypothetical protein